jgi:hypothetical protein
LFRRVVAITVHGVDGGLGDRTCREQEDHPEPDEHANRDPTTAAYPGLGAWPHQSGGGSATEDPEYRENYAPSREKSGLGEEGGDAIHASPRRGTRFPLRDRVATGRFIPLREADWE